MSQNTYEIVSVKPNGTQFVLYYGKNKLETYRYMAYTYAESFVQFCDMLTACGQHKRRHDVWELKDGSNIYISCIST